MPHHSHQRVPLRIHSVDCRRRLECLIDSHAFGEIGRRLERKIDLDQNLPPTARRPKWGARHAGFGGISRRSRAYRGASVRYLTLFGTLHRRILSSAPAQHRLRDPPSWPPPPPSQLSMSSVGQLRPRRRGRRFGRWRASLAGGSRLTRADRRVLRSRYPPRRPPCVGAGHDSSGGCASGALRS